MVPRRLPVAKLGETLYHHMPVQDERNMLSYYTMGLGLKHAARLKAA